MVKEQCVDASGKPLIVPHKEKGYLYFVNTDGKVMKAKMQTGKKLTPEQIKAREAAKAKRTADYQKRLAANRAKRAARLAEINKRAEAKIAARKAKLEEMQA